MKNILFSQTVVVDLQGPHVLDYLENTGSAAIYQLIGLQSPPIFIIDHRIDVNNALTAYIHSNNLYKFPDIFAKPAQAVLHRDQPDKLVLELFDTLITVPDYMIWIVVGMEEEFPEYPYSFAQIEPLGENKVAGFAIYALTRQEMISFVSNLSPVCVSL